jgi:Asp-tRNA(Asn)/Glu-tRNA(Gln) amidotransferase A subunit family amidase
MMSFSLVDDLRSGRIPLPEFLAQVESHFGEHEPVVQAFLTEDNRFRRLQKEASALLERYPDLIRRPVLFGALAGIKDIFHVKGFVTQAGSRLPAGLLGGEEAESVRRLNEAGAFVLGKTVTTEFAYFTPGPTRNPHNPEHTPGGSSSGSAAAVAAGFCHVALGTQTIGSIIRPASFCGVVGLKPTYDRISRAGVIPLSPSLDHVGFFTPDIETAVQAARALYKDWDEPIAELKQPRLGIPEGSYLAGASQENRTHFENVSGVLEKAGYELQRVDLLPDFEEVRRRHDIIMSAEAAHIHHDWFGKHEALYSGKFTELIRRGQQVTDEQLQDAITARDKFRARMRNSFIDHNIDLWISPSTVGAAPRGLESTGDPIMNLPWTQAGLPALNLPAGSDAQGLPLGLQVVGNWNNDESLLFWASDMAKALLNL